MNGYGIFILLLILLFGVIIGVATHFYQNMGVNIGRNYLRGLGMDDEEKDEDLKR